MPARLPTPALPTRRQACLALAAAAALPLATPVWALDKPAGKVVLSVTGKVSQANAEGRADFDMAMLAALPQRSFSANTPWYKTPKKFTGPLLRDVLAAAGAKGTTLVAVALNDYKIEIPFEDAQRFDMVMARLLDDQPMPTREKGPLFIVYPYDSSAELRSERYYSRSAWQLRTLEVK